jgi:hypothetical protein
MTKRPEGLIKLPKKALHSEPLSALTYSFDKTLINNEWAIEVTESEAVKYTIENHTLLHEAEFAGRIKNAAGTLRFNPMHQNGAKLIIGIMPPNYNFSVDTLVRNFKSVSV